MTYRPWELRAQVFSRSFHDSAIFLLHSFVHFHSRAEDPTPVDPHQWLEAVEDENAWIGSKKKQTVLTKLPLEMLSRYKNDWKAFTILKVDPLCAKTRRFILYSYDEDHPRGVWRRTTLRVIRVILLNGKILDLDELATTENETGLVMVRV